MGMGKLLGAPPFPLILMEYEPPMQRGAGYDAWHVLDVLRAHGYTAFCPRICRGTECSSSTKGSASASSKGGALSEMVLPGSKFEPKAGNGRNASATWRLGTALVPQHGAPDCIDAVFIHARRLYPGGGNVS